MGTLGEQNSFAYALNDQGQLVGESSAAVFAVMDRHISVGEIDDIYQALPKDLRRLWPALEPT